MSRTVSELDARLRQLHAADRNAMDIYSDLLKDARDPETKAVLEQLAGDEARHAAMDREMIAIVESYRKGGKS